MTTEILKNVWYAAALSKELKATKPLPVIICGEPIVLWRKQDGGISAIRDICPHRGIPFSFGCIKQDMIECPYHGWKFDGQGLCQEIPSLTSSQKMETQKIKVRSYPAEERNGLLWIFFGEKSAQTELAPQLPDLSPFARDRKPNMILKNLFKCHIDHAVIGLMDPAHGPFVHKGALWRSEKSILEKNKKFGPVDFGFQMRKHPPSANSKAYRILGGELTTEITFSLPSVRVERIQAGKNHFYSLTALTPKNEKETVIHQMLYWDIPWLFLIKPFLRKFARGFLQQDIDVVEKQQIGLAYDPSLMLIKDGDTQAKWYYALKSSWIESQSGAAEFKNPVPETTLSWRS